MVASTLLQVFTDALLEPFARSGAGYLLQTTRAVQLGNAASIFISIPDLLFSGIGLPMLPINEGEKKGGGGKKLFDFFLRDGLNFFKIYLNL